MECRRFAHVPALEPTPSELIGPIESSPKVCDLRSVPVAEVRIEVYLVKKKIVECRRFAHVPALEPTSSELIGHIESSLKVCNLRSVPVA